MSVVSAMLSIRGLNTPNADSASGLYFCPIPFDFSCRRRSISEPKNDLTRRRRSNAERSSLADSERLLRSTIGLQRTSGI